MPATTSGSVSVVVAVEVGAKPLASLLMASLSVYAAVEVNGAAEKRFAPPHSSPLLACG
jgi:hypothetical protein